MVQFATWSVALFPSFASGLLVINSENGTFALLSRAQNAADQGRQRPWPRQFKAMSHH
jgi:hypothetical protein